MGLFRLDGGPHHRIDLRCFEEHEEAAALLHCTGSGEFNRVVQRVALAKGYQLSEKGLCRASKLGSDTVMKTGEYLPLSSEQDIFDHLGLLYVEPRDREFRADVLDAATGRSWFQNGRGRAARGDDSDEEEDLLALPAPSAGPHLPAPPGHKQTYENLGRELLS